MQKHYLLLAPLAALLLASAPRLAQAQTTGSVGIGTTAPDASAALDIVSSSKGVLPPRLSNAQRDAMNPGPLAAGLLIYNTDSKTLNTWDGTKWVLNLVYDAGTTVVATPTTTTFGYTGSSQYYTVPAGVTRLTVVARGAAGAQTGGVGAVVNVTVTVTPGEVLQVEVGGQGQPYNGGGSGFGNGANASGGGATDLRRAPASGGTGDYLSSRNALLVAGGAGGGFGGFTGGNGGTPNGGNGNNVVGATQSGPGTSGQGESASFGGGGGGGYYGGSADTRAGAGGSSWISLYVGATNVNMTLAPAPANGSLSITPSPALTLPAPVLTGSNLTGVPGAWGVNGTSYYYNGGNVGIGNTAPSQKLEVEGSVKISGTGNGLTFPDGTVQKTKPVLSINGQSLTINGTDGNTVTLPTNTGPAGATGPAGPTGATGVQGATGATGPAGPAGTNASVTASNGVSVASGNVKLGGNALTAATDVPLAGNTLTFSGTGNVGLGTAADPITQKLDVRGNMRLGDNANGGTGAGQAIEWVGPGVNTDPVGLYRYNTANDASELRLVVGDVADSNDRFSVGRMNGTSNEGGIPTGTFTPNFTVRSDGNVGVGTGTPTSTLQVAGSVAASIRTLSGGTIADNDYTVIITGSVSLPTPNAANAGRLYHIINGNGGNYTVTGTLHDAGSPGTSGSANLTGFTDGKGITVQSDGTQWWIIGRE